MKTETDTPRSAKCAYQARQQTIGKWIVPYAKAQELERELNAAKALAEQNGKLAHDYSIAAVKFKGQLNEAITELSHIANLLDDHFEEGGIITGMGTTNKAREIIAKSKQ